MEVAVDFIFMLTRDDTTIEDCIEVFDAIIPLGIKHIGCKDVGVDRKTLKKLVKRIKDNGGTSYLEVVSTSDNACLKSVRTALEIGMDCLMGGTNSENILQIIKGNPLRYYPFPGKPIGHPTKLGGAPQEIAADCRRFEKIGCAGVDLLAYRANEADPLSLVRAARKALKGYLICAGSVDSPEKIKALKAAGCDAFTIGSSVFNGSFSPRKGSMISQLKDILACL